MTSLVLRSGNGGVNFWVGFFGFTPVGWHTLRHSLGTLMKANGEDVKTIHETLRHANFKVTMDVYTQAVMTIKRSAHDRVVRQIMDVPEHGEKA